MISSPFIGVHSLASRSTPPGLLARINRSLRARARKILRPRVIAIDGIKLEVDRNRLPAQVVRALYAERYEKREADLVRRSLKRGDRVLEIGAGIGFISLLCARICGPDAVLCYEANPANEDCIRRNFELNNLFPQFRNRAISVAGGEAMLFVEPNFLSTGLISRGNGTKMAVPCDGISDVIHDFRPTCLVMDVEGAEIDLLPAARLDGVNKVILETHARVVGPPALQRLHEHMEGQGFRNIDADIGRVALYERRAA